MSARVPFFGVPCLCLPGACPFGSPMIHLVHILQQIHRLGRVAHLVVVPGHHLHEVVVEGDARLGVEDGVVVVAQESLETTSSSV